MKRYLLMAGLVFMSFSALAQSKAEVESMLDQMAKSGMVSSEQIKEARAKLKGMDEKEFENLVEAGKAMRNDPAIRRKIKEMKLGR